MIRQSKVQIMAVSALLCAIGILIPMIGPKFLIEPASFTLASHVPIFIAMFMSPIVAISVSIITGFGFLIAGFPIVVVLRALSHIVFVAIGAYWLKKNPHILNATQTNFIFALIISIIHGICEVAVVTFFYWGSQMTSIYYEQGYLVSVVLLVGVGTIIHSMIDYRLALFVWKPIQKIATIK